MDVEEEGKGEQKEGERERDDALGATEHDAGLERLLDLVDAAEARRKLLLLACEQRVTESATLSRTSSADRVESRLTGRDPPPAQSAHVALAPAGLLAQRAFGERERPGRVELDLGAHGEVGRLGRRRLAVGGRDGPSRCGGVDDELVACGRLGGGSVGGRWSGSVLGEVVGVELVDELALLRRREARVVVRLAAVARLAVSKLPQVKRRSREGGRGRTRRRTRSRNRTSRRAPARCPCRPRTRRACACGRACGSCGGS